MTMSESQILAALDFEPHIMCDTAWHHPSDPMRRIVGAPVPITTRLTWSLPCCGQAWALMCPKCCDTFVHYRSEFVDCARCGAAHPGPIGIYVANIEAI